MTNVIVENVTHGKAMKTTIKLDSLPKVWTGSKHHTEFHLKFYQAKHLLKCIFENDFIWSFAMTVIYSFDSCANTETFNDHP